MHEKKSRLLLATCKISLELWKYHTVGNALIQLQEKIKSLCIHFFIIYNHRHQFLTPTPAVVPLTTTQTPTPPHSSSLSFFHHTFSLPLGLYPSFVVFYPTDTIANHKERTACDIMSVLEWLWCLCLSSMAAGLEGWELAGAGRGGEVFWNSKRKNSSIIFFRSIKKIFCIPYTMSA